MQYVRFMTLSDVVGTPGSVDELRRVLRRHHWRSWFKVSAILSYLVSYPDVDQEWVRLKFHTMFPSSPLARAAWRLEQIHGWRVLTLWQPLLIMKAALAEHFDEVPEDDHKLANSEDYLRACLILSGLLDDQEPEYTEQSLDLDAQRYVIREQSVQLPHDHTRLFALYSAVFGDLATELDDQRQALINQAHAECFGGLTATQMLDIGLAIVAQYATRDPQRETRTVFDLTWLKAPGITAAERSAFWSLCLLSPQVGSEWARRHPYTGVDFFTDFGLLKAFPLLERRDGTADAVSARHLLYRVTEGIYHTLRIELFRRGRHDLHGLVNAQLGEVFEEYVRRLTQSACSSWFRPDRYYSSRSLGQRREMADVVLVDGNALVLCEVKAASLMRDTSVTGDLDAFDRDMQRHLLLDAAAQLHKTATDLLCGDFDSETLDHRTVLCIYPVVVTREHVPSHGFLRERIERVIASDGILQQQPVHKLTWFSLTEWEMVCAAASIAGGLTRVLGPCVSHNDPKISFGEIAQRQAVQLDAPPNPYVDERLQNVREQARRRLFPPTA